MCNCYECIERRRRRWSELWDFVLVGLVVGCILVAYAVAKS